ncbi:tRNA glutamyl-Q(34) synthetase GluQRS [Chiayiivirga flava]|uniref:Glutamyl-Q tRNA(Asp) synthetase n=1 Tax=Chiayiivirga flava TaxID=659595 RepID=A0A7W8D5V0_9GAMM|nr:glutamyl-Q tRNA(Asp) synthetase [Chiayiivirga flava]
MSGPAGYRGRFAPSPTGALHFGSLLAAFASWLRARQAAGTWLVRIEDLDPPREIPGAADGQIDTLRDFGFESDEPVLRQSTRGALYDAELQRLRAAGLAFDCRCSRSDLAAGDGIHRACVAGDVQRAAAIRARVPDIGIGFDDLLQGPQRQALGREVGDFVLRRVEGYYAYQLAVVVDDAAQGITEVVRGADLLDSTARQIWLQRALGYPTPAYLHLPLALDAAGAKLGKSLHALPLDREHRIDALCMAWRFLGQAPEAVLGATSVDALLQRAIRHFDPARIPRANRSAVAS